MRDQAHGHPHPDAARARQAEDRVFQLPELRTLLRDALKGRRAAATPLFRIVFQHAFMNNWDISMRYADARQIKDDWVQAWQKQARDAVSAMGT